MNRGKFTAALTALCAASAVPVGVLASATPRTLVTLEDHFWDALGDVANVEFCARPPLCRGGMYLSIGYTTKFADGGRQYGSIDVDLRAETDDIVQRAKMVASHLGRIARSDLNGKHTVAWRSPLSLGVMYTAQGLPVPLQDLLFARE